MRLAVVIVLVVLVAARFELSIRSGPAANVQLAGEARQGFAIDLRLGGVLAGLRP